MANQVSQLLTLRAAWIAATGGLPGLEGSMAKLYASEVAMRVTYDAIQLFGGFGYSREYPVERMWRDAKLCTIGEGTSEIQKLVISRGLIDKGLE